MKSERDVIVWHTLPHLEHESAIEMLSVNANDEDFIELLNETQQAIDAGINPVLITTGSSGSYYVRDKDGRNIGVFKPKDEEPKILHSTVSSIGVVFIALLCKCKSLLLFCIAFMRTLVE
uniref:Phosphatidylinositol 4-kinase type 2 n=1 Tax=Parascaris equorum TaxID=6256 RepID=A0A914RRR4_PAREQ